ncbi:MAG: hypothetical protein ACI82G_002409 [Bradymonadia bacterium]|jgi:hypothetical protein
MSRVGVSRAQAEPAHLCETAQNGMFEAEFRAAIDFDAPHVREDESDLADWPSAVKRVSV